MVEKSIAKGAATAKGTNKPPVPKSSRSTINTDKMLPSKARIFLFNPRREKLNEFFIILNKTRFS